MKKKVIYSHKCDWCNRELILNGSDSDSYVVTAEYKYFCIIQDKGKPAERDCMADYLNNIRKKLNEHTVKKELEKKRKRTRRKRRKRKENKINA